MSAVLQQDTATIGNFCGFMNDRHQIYLDKEAGLPKPWTDDPILQSYKFTNVYRQLDKETQRLTARKKRLARATPAELLWHIAVFRMPNWAETYDALNEAGLLDKWNTARAVKVLKARQANDKKVFTGAYVITNNGSTRDKVELVCEALEVFYKGRTKLAKAIAYDGTLQGAWKLVCQLPMWGPFTGYELITDLRWTPLLEDASDIMTWANAGPGAKRGCNRIFRGDKGSKVTAFRYLDEMKYILESSSEYLGDHMEPLELRDIEHSLCEFDKYMRVQLGEGKPRSKYNGTAD